MEDHPESGGPTVRAPPHSKDAETALIGGVLRGGKRPDVPPEAFYFPQHRLIWAALREIDSPDAVLLSTRLSEQRMLERAGGNGYIAHILDATTNISNNEAYAGIVLDRWGMRQRIAAARELSEAAFEQDDEALRETESKIAANGWAGARKPWRTASEIAPAGVDWIWRHWLPAGELTLFAAPGGSGKGTFWCHLCACMTNRAPWPDGKITDPVAVAVYSAEDDDRKELVPRLKLAGADLDMVFVLETIEEAYDPPPGVGMVVLDPIGIGFDGDGNAQTSVRPYLMRWAHRAQELDIAYIGVHHFGKYASTKTGAAARDLAIGSTAWVDCSRWCLMMARDRSDETASRILIRAKGNLGGVDYSFGGYRVHAETGDIGRDDRGRLIENKYVKRMEHVEGDADEMLFEALKPPSKDEDVGDNESANAILDVLTRLGGKALRTELVSECKHNGVGASTVQKWLPRLEESNRISYRLARGDEIPKGAKTAKIIELAEQEANPWR